MSRAVLSNVEHPFTPSFPRTGSIALTSVPLDLRAFRPRLASCSAAYALAELIGTSVRDKETRLLPLNFAKHRDTDLFNCCSGTRRPRLLLIGSSVRDKETRLLPLYNIVDPQRVRIFLSKFKHSGSVANLS